MEKEKKPSERIQEIHEAICKAKGWHPQSEVANDFGVQEAAIIQFLDEQHEGKSFSVKSI